MVRIIPPSREGSPLAKVIVDLAGKSEKAGSALERDPLLEKRLRHLRPFGEGPITALTGLWRSEDFTRFRFMKEAVTYCRLCGDENRVPQGPVRRDG